MSNYNSHLQYHTPVAYALTDWKEMRTSRAKHTDFCAVGYCSSFAGGGFAKFLKGVFFLTPFKN